MLTGRRDQFVTVPQDGPHGADALPGPKCSPQ